MTPAKTTPQPDPPQELISSERVRFLTSWKLWLPLLFAALALIVAAVLWQPYHRMRAMDLIESRHGDYLIEETRWQWLAGRIGKLGDGFDLLYRIEVHRELSLAELQTITILNEVESLILVAAQVTPEWIEGLRSFYRLKYLSLEGEITGDQVLQLLDAIPTLEELSVGRVAAGDHLAYSQLSEGAKHLRHLRIEECRPRLTIEGFPALKDLWIDEMEDAELVIRDLPSLEVVHLHNVNEGTALSHDAPLKNLSYGIVSAETLRIPSDVRRMHIMNVGHCTIAGGDESEELQIYESSDIAIEGLSALERLECTTSFGGTLALRNLPQLEHFILMALDAHSSPNLELDGVDNLRAIDAPWWRPNESQLTEVLGLPQLEHLVIPRANLTPEIIPRLQAIETLRFLRLPRRLYGQGDTDFAQLRREFPQPGIRIHGPPRVSEQDDRWSSSP